MKKTLFLLVILAFNGCDKPEPLVNHTPPSPPKSPAENLEFMAQWSPQAGRFQLKETTTQLLKIDTCTGRSWLLQSAVANEQNITGWIEIPDLLDEIRLITGTKPKPASKRTRAKTAPKGRFVPPGPNDTIASPQPDIFDQIAPGK